MDRHPKPLQGPSPGPTQGPASAAHHGAGSRAAPRCAACRGLRAALAALAGLGAVAWLLAATPAAPGALAPAKVAAPLAPPAAAPVKPPIAVPATLPPAGTPAPASAAASAPLAPPADAPTAAPPPAALAGQQAPAAAGPPPAAQAPPAGAVPPSPPTVAKAPPAAAGPELVFDRLVLVRLPVGRPWKGMRLVHRGQPPYALAFDAERLPPGLSLGSDGWLRGTPTAVGRYDFLLRLEGPPGGPPRAQQRYRIDVTAGSGARQPPPPPPPVLTAEIATRVVDTQPQLPRSWRLSAQAVEKLSQPDPAPEPAAEDEGAEASEATGAASAPAGTPPAVPTAEQLAAILGPLQDLEFPTETLMREALEASVCRYFVQHLSQQPPTVGAPGTAGAAPATPPATPPESDLRCPPEPLSAQAQAAAARTVGGMTLPQFHTTLMSPERSEAVLTAARWPHELAALQPLDLQPRPGCGCNPGETAGEVVGLLAYWHGSAQPQPVDFSAVTRVSYLGALLKDDGSITASFGPGSGQDLRFVRQAQRHATAVDLVLHKRDWRGLQGLSPGARADGVRRAVDSAMALLETRLDDADALLHRLLVPPWRESDHAFDGLTLWFDEPEGEPQQAAAFKSFVHAYVPALLQRLRERHRGLRLNIVVPEQRLGAAGGPWDVSWLWQTWRLTEAGLSEQQVAERRRALIMGEDLRRVHPTEISLRWLVLLPEPTTDSKKRLRARLDASSDVSGTARVALLRDTVPLLVHQREGPQQPLPAERSERFSNDFAYMGWNFGGVGLWPLPVTDLGHGQAVLDLLGAIYRPGAHWSDGLCAWICPNRVPLRLALQVLVLIGVLSIGLYLWSCEVRKIGRPYEAGLLLGGVLTVGVALALLSCDSDMESWRRDNVILYLLIAALFAWLAWRRLRPPPPRR